MMSLRLTSNLIHPAIPEINWPKTTIHLRISSYLNELKRSNGGQLPQVGIEEGSRRMGGIVSRYSIRLALGFRSPVGGRESEAVVGASVYGVYLESDVES